MYKTKSKIRKGFDYAKLSYVGGGFYWNPETDIYHYHYDDFDVSGEYLHQRMEDFNKIHPVTVWSVLEKLYDEFYSKREMEHQSKITID